MQNHKAMQRLERIVPTSSDARYQQQRMRSQQTAADSSSSITLSPSTQRRVDLIPSTFTSPWFASLPSTQAHLAWMTSKHALHQDMYLLGTCGPLRRWLVLHWCAVKNLEVEYIHLTRDSSESDLKQRREITESGTSIYADQSVLSAALNGRILIIEGIEHVERNVLPILNNLLENREMALEDGRFLVAPQRYAHLMAEAKRTGRTYATEKTLVPVHANFRVIGISVPVPPLRGNLLDAPLRSRFQCRRIDSIPIVDMHRLMVRSLGLSASPSTSPSQLAMSSVLAFAEALRSLTSSTASLASVESRTIAAQHLPSLSEIALLTCYRLLTVFPSMHISDVLSCVYPWRDMMVNEEAKGMLEKVWNGVVGGAGGGEKGKKEEAEEEKKKSLPPTTKQPESSILPPTRTTPVSSSLDLTIPRYLLTAACRPSSLEANGINSKSTDIVSLSPPLETDVICRFDLSMPIQNGKVNPSTLVTSSSPSTHTRFVRVRGGSGTAASSSSTSLTSPSSSSSFSSAILPPILPSYTGGSLHHATLSAMLLSHSIGRDICLLGGKGEGKTYLIRQFAALLGYTPVQTIFLYKDQTARDLLQRRTTNSSGATIWQDSPLVLALHTGALAVLDGIDRLHAGILGILDKLIVDRELQLFDGTRFVSYQQYWKLRNESGMSENELRTRRIYPIHPSFRLITLATPPDKMNGWLDHNVLHQFTFFSYSLSTQAMDSSVASVSPSTAPTTSSSSSSSSSPSSLVSILLNILPTSSPAFLSQLVAFSTRLHHLSHDPLLGMDSEGITCSLRQMLRVARYHIQLREQSSPSQSQSSPTLTPQQLNARITEKIENVLMLRYIPITKRDIIHNVLKATGFVSASGAKEKQEASLLPSEQPLTISASNNILSIGSVSVPQHTPLHPELIPDQFIFFPIPSHVQLMQRMLLDIQAKEHICLIGNQGTGKNKCTDRLLQLMRRERQYIQLHRDTTVTSLTLTPSLINGRIYYMDSPLVLSMIHGYCLMIDEIDKASLEVIVILKALLEDGEILLSDGRRFVDRRKAKGYGEEVWTKEGERPAVTAMSSSSSPSSSSSTTSYHLIHPSFFVIALANPPGFPFLGNNFFSQLGDIFSCHAIDNPGYESEMELVSGYGPKVPKEIRKKLVSVFQELRELNREGILSYPYSTRELVSIIKHLNAYPNDSISQVLRNILDFDSYDEFILQTLLKVFQKHGIVTGDLYQELVKEIDGQDGEGSVITQKSTANLPIRLSQPFPLPPAICVGTLETDSTSRINTNQRRTLDVSVVKQVQLYAPQSYERPISEYLVDLEGEKIASIDSDAKGANVNAAAADSSTSNASLRSTSHRLEYRASDRHYSSRTSQFSEELFHFTHASNGGFIPNGLGRSSNSASDTAASSAPVFVRSFRPGFIHFLTLKPFTLVTYDLSTPKTPSFTTIHLMTQIVRVWLDEEMFAPILVVCESAKKVVVFVPQFDALLVIDPFKPEVCCLSVRMNSARLSGTSDRFKDTQIPTLMTCLSSSTCSIIALIQRGSQLLYLVDILTGASLTIETGVDVYAIDVMYNDRIMLRDGANRTFDLILEGMSWCEEKKKQQPSPLHITTATLSTSKLRVMHDPPLIDLSATYISHSLPNAEQLMPSDIKVEHVKIVTAGASKESSASTSQQKSSVAIPSPTRLHLWHEDGLLAGFIVDYPLAALQKQPTPKVATLFAHMRHQQQLPASFAAATTSSTASPTTHIRTQTPARHVSLFLHSTNELLHILSYEREVVLELIHIRTASMRILSLPRASRSGSMNWSLDAQVEHHVLAAVELQDGRVCLLTRGGTVRVFEFKQEKLEEQKRAWKAMLGVTEEKEQQQQMSEGDGGSSGDGGDDSNDGGSDKQSDSSTSDNGNDNDDSDSKGEGSGKGSGGVGKGRGGKGGKGSGGKGSGGGGGGGGGLFADLKFNRASTLSPTALRDRPLRDASDAAAAVDSASILTKARQLASLAKGKILDPTKHRIVIETEMYTRLYNAVAREINQLRVILEAVESREQERVWLKNQLNGELDDEKLIDSSVGEKNIYKRRGIEDIPPIQMIPKKPKRLRFVMDISSSMARFNAQDRRLDRMVATTVMIMESFSGLSHKFDYSIVGQDGSSPLIPLIEFGKPPRTQADRIRIIEMMQYNASFCQSGDHTLPAAHLAIQEVTKQEGDDYFMFILSDANLYGITPEAFAEIMLADPKVHSYAIFIAGEAQALPLTRTLPVGHGFVCTDTSHLPRIFKGIFTEALANTRRMAKL